VEKKAFMSRREYLKAVKGMELLEMERRKDNGWCCGYGVVWVPPSGFAM